MFASSSTSARQVGENGRRKQKKFQRLTDEYGMPQLLHLLGKQEGIMLGFKAGDWDGFYDRLNRLMPPYKKLPLLVAGSVRGSTLEADSISITGLVTGGNRRLLSHCVRVSL